MVLQKRRLRSAEIHVLLVGVQTRQVVDREFSQFRESLAQETPDQELRAAEIGLENRKRQVRVLPRVGAFVAVGAIAVAHTAGEVFNRVDLVLQARHDALHQFCWVGKQVWRAALRDP